MEQPQYNLLAPQRVEFEYARLYDDIGLGLTTWSPLASGVLTGKYLDGMPDGCRGTLPGYEWLQHALTDERTNDAGARAQGDRRRPRLHARAAVARVVREEPARVDGDHRREPRVEQVRENLVALDVLAELDDGVMHHIDEVLMENRARFS